MKTNIKAFLIILFLSAFIMAISFGGQKAEWKGTIEEDNGVTVVKNPKEPIYGEGVFSLEEELSIGEKEKEPVFEALRTIRVDDDENIYVLDYKANTVKVFDKNGKYLRDSGRKG